MAIVECLSIFYPLCLLSKCILRERAHTHTQTTKKSGTDKNETQIIPFHNHSSMFMAPFLFAVVWYSSFNTLTQAYHLNVVEEVYRFIITVIRRILMIYVILCFLLAIYLLVFSFERRPCLPCLFNHFFRHYKN